MQILKLAFLVFVFMISFAWGQEKKSPWNNSSKPGQEVLYKLNPQDVVSIDSIIKAVFDELSGPAGKKRDWVRFRSLFKPSAQFLSAPLQKNGKDFGFKVRNIDEYIRESEPWLLKNSMFEKEVHRVTEQFGPMAHINSTSEYRQKVDDIKPSGRYVSSYQMIYENNRWWIINWYWVGESANFPIPDKYLPKP